MKLAAVSMACALGLANGDVWAQMPAAAVEGEQAPRPGSSVPAFAKGLTAADKWILSETTSPIDYSPVVVATATAFSDRPDGSLVQLSISCRGGRAEIAIGGPAVTKRGEDYIVSYRVDDTAPMGVAVGAPASGIGIALKGDVSRLLASLPDRGTIAFRLAPRQGDALEGRYGLVGLKSLRNRLAVACGWPASPPAPRHRH